MDGHISLPLLLLLPSPGVPLTSHALEFFLDSIYSEVQLLMQSLVPSNLRRRCIYHYVYQRGLNSKLNGTGFPFSCTVHSNHDFVAYSLSLSLTHTHDTLTILAIPYHSIIRLRTVLYLAFYYRGQSRTDLIMSSTSTTDKIALVRLLCLTKIHSCLYVFMPIDYL